VVRLKGELDLACQHDFSALHAELAERQPPCVVVDARGVTFIDCAGYGLLVELNRAVVARGGSFFLTNPSRAITRLMSLSSAVASALRER
jgi:anti-anti-sigma factor